MPTKVGVPGPLRPCLREEPKNTSGSDLRETRLTALRRGRSREPLIGSVVSSVDPQQDRSHHVRSRSGTPPKGAIEAQLTTHRHPAPRPRRVPAPRREERCRVPSSRDRIGWRGRAGHSDFWPPDLLIAALGAEMSLDPALSRIQVQEQGRAHHRG